MSTIQRLFRFGTGCGLEIRGNDLLAVVLKSRPAGVTVLGRKTIRGFRERLPQEWGAEYNAFLKELGLSHLAATIALPRGEVILRQLQLPPVSGKDLAAAIELQMDSLHPFGEDEVYHAHAALAAPGEEGAEVPVAVVIAERANVDAYAEMFEAAGIAAASFSVAAAAFYTGIRVRWDTPPVPFLITDFHDGKLEIYGESSNRPFFSAEFDLSSLSALRALQLAAADLRLEGDQQAVLAVCGSPPEDESGESTETPAAGPGTAFEPRSISEILPAPLAASGGLDPRRDATALAVALEAACPRLGWRANLLPKSRRRANSRWMYAPAAALAALLALLLVGFAVRPVIQDGRYLRALQTKRESLSAIVDRAAEIKTQTMKSRQRIELLQSLGQRTEFDLKILSELSNLIPDTAWLTQLTLNDDGVEIIGEAASAAPLLGRLSESRYLTEAAFATSLREIDSGQRFQIVARRRESGDEPPADEAPADTAPSPAEDPPAAPPSPAEPAEAPGVGETAQTPAAGSGQQPAGPQTPAERQASAVGTPSPQTADTPAPAAQEAP